MAGPIRGYDTLQQLREESAPFGDPAPPFFYVEETGKTYKWNLLSIANDDGDGTIAPSKPLSASGRYVAQAPSRGLASTGIAAALTLAALALLPAPAQSTVLWCHEVSAPFLYVAGDTTQEDGLTSIKPAGATTGRFLIGSSKIWISSIDGGVSDDWVRVNTILAAAAGKVEVGMRSFTPWLCATQGIVPGFTKLDAPNVQITTTLGIGGGVVFKQIDTVTGSGTLSANVTLGQNTLQSSTGVFNAGQWVRLVGVTNIHIGTKHRIEQATMVAAGTTPPVLSVAGNVGTQKIEVECTSIAGGAARGQWIGRWRSNGGNWTTFTSAAVVTMAGTGGTIRIAVGNAATNNTWDSQAAGARTYTVDRTVDFPFVIGDTIQLITARAADTVLNMPGAVVSGLCDYVVQFQAWNYVIRGLRVVQTSDGAMYAFSTEQGSVAGRLEDCSADLTQAVSASGGGLLGESAVRMVWQRFLCDGGGKAIWLVDCNDSDVLDCVGTGQSVGGIQITSNPSTTLGCKNVTVRGGGFHQSANIGVFFGYATDCNAIGVGCYYNVEGFNLGAGTTTVRCKLVDCSSKSNSNYCLTVRTTATGTKVHGFSSSADGGGVRIQNEVDFFGLDVLDCTVSNNYPFFVESSLVAGAKVNVFGGHISTATASVELASIQGAGVIVFRDVFFECKGTSQNAIKHYANSGSVVLAGCKGSQTAATTGYLGASGSKLRVESRNDFSAFTTPFSMGAGLANFGTFTLNGVNAVAVTGDFAADACISLSLKTVGGTPGTAAPYFSAAQTAGQFTVKSPTASANDVYNWFAGPGVLTP